MDESHKPKDRTPDEIKALSDLSSKEIYSATKSLNLAVDVFHINVEGKGDAAIHVLVHHDVVFTKPLILRTVLIDGGWHGEKNGAVRIKAVLNKIASEYDWDRTDGGRVDLLWPPFDSVVITHWDEDHYGGIQPLLSSDLFEKFNEWSISNQEPIRPTGEKVTAAALDDFNKSEDAWKERMGTFTGQYLSPFFKYKPPPVDGQGKVIAETSKTRGERALSFIYMPYWGKTSTWKKRYPSSWWETEGKGKHGYRDLNFDSSTTGKSNSWYPLYEGDSADDKSSDGPNIPGRFLNFNAHVEGGLNHRPEEQWVKRICRVRSGNANIMGANLFTHWRPHLHECERMKNPLALALAHVVDKSYTAASPKDLFLTAVTAAETNAMTAAPSVSAQPLLLVVAANVERCGHKYADGDPMDVEPAKDDDFKDEEPAEELEDGLTDQDKYMNWKDTRLVKTSAMDGKGIEEDSKPIRAMVIEEATGSGHNELTNKASIITMTVWSDGHISHYSAGDAQWEVEKEVVKWVQKGDNPFQCVRTVKLSHHGSEHSTPLELLRAFRPRSVVVSAGHNAFGHPEFKTLLYLHRWFATTNRIVPSGPGPSKLLHPTSYPYYLVRAIHDEETTGKRSLQFYKMADKNYNTLLSTGGKGVSKERRKFLEEKLEKLEARWPLSGMSVKLYRLFETAMSLAGPTKPAERAIILRNFTMEQTERALRGISDVQPETHPAVSKCDSSTGKMLPAGQRVEAVKAYCRSFSKQRRDLTLDKHIDGYTVTRTTLADADNSNRASRPAQKKRRRDDEDEQVAYIENLDLELERLKLRYDAAELKPYEKRRYESTIPEWREKAVKVLEKIRAGQKVKPGDQGLPRKLNALPIKAKALRALVESPGLSIKTADVKEWRLTAAFVLHGRANTDPAVVPIENEFEGFLLWIRGAVLTVDRTGTVLAADEFRGHLFRTLDLDTGGTSALQVTYEGDISEGRVSGLKLIVSKERFGHELIFETAAAASQFKAPFMLQAMNKYIFPASGIVPQNNTLLLALRNSSDDWTFTQILTYLDLLPLPGAARDAISDLESALDVGVKFKLHRGTIWFCPELDYGIVQRMEWNLKTTDVERWLAKGFLKLGTGISIEEPLLVGRKTTQQMDTSNGPLYSDSYEFIVMTTLARTVAGSTTQRLITTFEVDLANGGTSIKVCINLPDSNLPDSGTLVNILKWLAALVGENDSTLLQIVDWIPGIHTIQLRRVELVCNKKGPQRFSLDLQWTPGWTNKAADDPAAAAAKIPFLLTYTWTAANKPKPHKLIAQVWAEPAFVRDPRGIPAEITPYFEIPRVIRPSVPASAPIHLQSLMPGDYKLPSELDLNVYELVLSLEGNKVSFTGVLASANVEPKDDDLGIRLDEVTIRASYERGETAPGAPRPGGTIGPRPKSESSYSLFLEAVVDITPPMGTDSDDAAGDAHETDPPTLVASISVESHGKRKVCLLHGSLANLNLADLGRFFPVDDRQIVTDLLGHIRIESLNIVYRYDSGSASDFDITALLRLGPCQLGLAFHRDPKSWTFEALLQAEADSKPTIEDLLQEIFEDDIEALENVPSFVKDMSLAGKDAFVSLKLASVKAPDAATVGRPAAPNTDTRPKYVIMSLTARLPVPEGAGIEFTFMQITEKPPPVAPGIPGVPPPAIPQARGFTRSLTKRLIRVSVVDLPWNRIPNPPVVGKIQPLFDELQFLWVQDPAAKGVTRQEVDVLRQFGSLQFKEAFRQPKPIDNLLTPGIHFCIADASILLLDYVFGQPKKALPDSTPTVPPRRGRLAPKPAAPAVPDLTSSGQGTATSELSKKVGPITVSNVGLRYEDDELLLYLDVAATLGPVEVMLLGFGIGLNLKRLNLQNLTSVDPSFQLKGMGISFQQPPVGIAGMFKDASNATQRLYMGGVAISFKPYSFMAVGEYGEIARPGTTLKDNDTFKTLFIFAKLEGPLIELEFVTIGGITLGFGYNSNLRFPKIAEVPTFPFIASAGLGGNPLAVMNQLVGRADSYVKPQEDSYWIAAGLQAKAFQVLDVSAVVVLEFSPYVNLGIFAKAIAQMPPAPTPQVACFLYVELGLMCTVDFHAGAFRVEAQLSPNSFVIHPSCHLTGGFALCYWFPPSAYSGDFVFTVGGYHPLFKPPAHYPNPPRLGISWKLGPVAVRGEAYFAITPQCCMGGGRLEATFNAGLLHAYFTAYADFFIVYHPFFFMGDVGVCVGVRFTMDILFVTIHISVELSARLRLRGPPFGGVAHVDFWVFGFDIPFGSQPGRPKAKTLQEFATYLLEVPDAEAVARAANPAGSSSAGSIDKLHVLSVEAGRFTNKTKNTQSDPGEMWEVKRAGFRFRVQSRVPLRMLTEITPNETDQDIVLYSPEHIYCKPMQLKREIESAMTVTISKVGEQGSTQLDEVAFVPTAVVKQVPRALWDSYNERTDPTSGGGNTSQLESGSAEKTMNLLMGATFSAPPPFRSQDRVLKYNVLLSGSLDVFTADDNFTPNLPRKIRTASSNMRSAQPLAGPAQYDAVKSTWKKSSSGEESAVRSFIDTWAKVMGWSGHDPLKNDLEEAAPILFDQFDHLYMAAPMIIV